MNDIKYVMLPRIEEKTKQIKPRPWYKERLKDKYLTKNPNNTEKLFDAKQWTFIKDGLDDFRDGLPPPHDDLIIKPKKGPAPTIKNDKWKFKEQSASPSNRLTVNQRCFSKKLPLAEARQNNIEEIINGLTQHPLALYSHLEEALPADLFEEILDILDPEINQKSDVGLNDSDFGSESKSHSASLHREGHFKPRRFIQEDLAKIEEELKKENNEKKSDELKKNVRNTYKWLLKKEEARAKAKGPEPEEIKAQAIDNHIKKVTVEYCDWVKSLGGEHNIDPPTLTSLFASGYDTKPPLSVPINIVELTNIPPELRATAFVPPSFDNHEEKERNIYREEDTTPYRKGHFRYGAWYLPKKHWRLMEPNEKLTDPKVVKDVEKEEAKKRSEEINAKLAPLHGAHLFKQFVKEKQPDRVPKLLEELDEWQNEQLMKKIAASQNQNHPTDLNSSLNE